MLFLFSHKDTKAQRIIYLSVKGCGLYDPFYKTVLYTYIRVEADR